MPRYIDADALMEEIRSLQVTVTGLRLGKGVLNKYARFYRNSVMRVIDEQPTVNLVKIVYGQWKFLDCSESGYEVKCTNCGDEFSFCKKENIPEQCPNCRAVMDGGKHGN